MRRGKGVGAADFSDLPEPQIPTLEEPWGLLVTGVGGTGVITIGALMGMAAHLEGKGVSVLDMAGLAQKGGAVWSHVRFADRQERLFAARVAAGEADAVIGCDLVVSASDESLAKMRDGFTRAVINSTRSVTSEFVRGFAAQAKTGDVTAHPDPQFPLAAMEQQIDEATGGRAEFLDASRTATALLGDAIATNLFMLGYAWQRGWVPVSAEAILRAIEINGSAVEMNRLAFQWGRRAAHDPQAVARAATSPGDTPEHRRLSQTLDEVIARRVEHLTAYQNAAYARRYRTLVERARHAEATVAPGVALLAEAVARGYHKLLAYKDEFEVARLYAESDFLRQIDAQFEGDYTLKFHLAPPLWAKLDPVTGIAPKRRYGRYMMAAFRGLAKLRFLRNSPLDPFRYSGERQRDLDLIAEYEATMEEVLAHLRPDNLETAVELAALPQGMRGYGHIKARYVERARQRRKALLDAFHQRRPAAAGVGSPVEREVALTG